MSACLGVAMCVMLMVSCRSEDPHEHSGAEWLTLRPQDAWTGIVAEPCSLRITREDGDRFDATSANGIRVNDVTAIAIGPTGDVLLSASPVHGKPGIYMIDSRACSLRTVVAPVTKSTAHPDGADYFELANVAAGRKSLRVDYWYAPRIDRVADVAARTGLVRKSVRVRK